jgi:hypothetical protein
MNVKATRTPDVVTSPEKYTCGWCGKEVKRGSGKNRRYSTCRDCAPTELAFGSKGGAR